MTGRFTDHLLITATRRGHRSSNLLLLRIPENITEHLVLGLLAESKRDQAIHFAIEGTLA